MKKVFALLLITLALLSCKKESFCWLSSFLQETDITIKAAIAR